MQVTSSKKVNELMGHTENFNYCIEKKHFDENYKNFMERQMLMMVDNLNEQDLATLFKVSFVKCVQFDLTDKKD